MAGPQTRGYETEADIAFFGGSAGSTKSDSLIGLSIREHQRSLIFRREAVQLTGLEDRYFELIGRDCYQSQKRTFRFNHDGVERQVQLGSMQYPMDWQNYMGTGRDLIGFDEVTHFLESQVRAAIGWLRSPDPNQRKRVVMTGNPPTTPEGRWVVDFFAAWLDDNHPNPAKDGELRWYTTIGGKDQECPNGDPIEVEGESEPVIPLSRTVIRSSVLDNPWLLETGYLQQLQAMPEELRRAFLDGDFMAGGEDQPFQVIPTKWVTEAMDRWEPKSPKGPMDSIGVDVARGGKDKTVLAPRHDRWFDELIRFDGTETPDGAVTAGHVVQALGKSDAVVHIDAIGVGASPYDMLKTRVQTVDCINSRASKERDETGVMGFRNERARDWWRMREALDPENDTGICLPNDSKLKADLCTPRYKMVGQFLILIESKDDIIKRLGRSPDDGDAVVMALRNTPKKSKKAVTINFASEW